MTNAVLVLGGILSASTLIGCATLGDEARDTFAKNFSCPEERVEVRERKDIRPSDWLNSEVPPGEVAADPARLAMWNEQQAKLRADDDDRHSIFEVRGCGHELLYSCGHVSHGRASFRLCTKRDPPSGAGE